MAKIVDSTMVNICNYSDSYVSIPTQINPKGYLFEPSMEGQPFIIPLTFAEIRVVNGQSQVFREGALRFDKEIEKDVYEALNIYDWENILSDADIRDIILNPTKEKLERVVKITSISLIDRVRSMLTQMQNSGLYDISQRVIDLVGHRYQELYRNKRKSDIVVYKTKQETINEVKEEILSNELDKMKQELEEQIRKELEQEMKKKLNSDDKQESKTNSTMKRGRPPKNSK